MRAEPMQSACGQLFEARSALAAWRRVFVVSDYEWTFAHHPGCRNSRLWRRRSRPSWPVPRVSAWVWRDGEAARW